MFSAFFISAQSSLQEVVCQIAVGHLDHIIGGSGFLVNDSEGNQYIVTNDHVTAESGNITVIFREEDGKLKQFDKMIVLANDPLYDISILGFPMGSRIKRQGLKIDIGKIDNFITVFTAGYPDYRWSFKEGIILNNNVLAYRSGTIQRFLAISAYVNPGSSGGPLLREQPDAPEGYVVVGVNTLKSPDIDGTGYSIPSRRIVELLNIAAEKKSEKRIVSRDNDNIEKAEQIQFDNSISTSVGFTDYAGWYRFTIPAEGDLKIDFHSDENFYLELFDGRDKLIGSGTSYDSLNIKVSSGDLYLRISGKIPYWTTYRLSSLFKSFYKGYIHSAKDSPIVIKDGIWHTRILHNGDEEWFSIKINPGRAIILETEHLLNPHFEIYDALDTLLAESSFKINRDVNNYRWIYIPERLVTDLYIRLTGYSKIMKIYRFRTIEAMFASKNTTIEKAEAITSSTPTAGSIRSNEKKWYTLLFPGKKLDIKIEGGDYILELYDSGNTLLAENYYNNHLSVNLPHEEVFLCVTLSKWTGKNSNYIIFTEVKD
uniref:Uncharacterized protein n=1 Tax=uncultured bacterium contig00043 TaxID=1181530 RepID=A0A806JZH6_9BACT|nr:hypothetical protein [uncultured bacterium contig00043]